MTFTQPTMPGTTRLFQDMIDLFGTAGTIGVAIIGAAVALGILILLARWGWGLLKNWLALQGDGSQYSDDYLDELQRERG